MIRPRTKSSSVAPDADPFFFSEQAIISFSGGRTSGYMLWRILQAHGGALPDHVKVFFVNTGREMPATLDFVSACADAWNVHIRWLEYRREENTNRAVEVTRLTASQQGEPFEALAETRSYLPNPVARFCTVELKIRTMHRFARDTFGWTRWLNIVGLRADEPRRVERALDPARQKRDGYVTVCPLAPAGIEEHHVLSFWKEQPFDLGLAGPWEGNCDCCFFKNRAALYRMWHDHPERLAWWQKMEQRTHAMGGGGTFRADREDIATMTKHFKESRGFFFNVDEPTLPCDQASCGI